MTKTPAPSASFLRAALTTAADDCAALLERCGRPSSGSASPGRDVWELHQEDLALVSARATDAAADLLAIEDIEEWVIIASAIHEMIDEVCLGRSFPAQLLDDTSARDASGDRSPVVEAAIEKALGTVTSALWPRTIALSGEPAPQQTIPGHPPEVTNERRTTPSERPSPRVGHGQLPVGGSQLNRLAAGQEQVGAR